MGEVTDRYPDGPRNILKRDSADKMHGEVRQGPIDVPIVCFPRQPRGGRERQRRARPTEYLPHFRGPPEHAIDAEFSEPPNRGKVLRRRDTDDLARAGLCPSSLEKAAPLDMRHGGAQ